MGGIHESVGTKVGIAHILNVSGFRFEFVPIKHLIDDCSSLLARVTIAFLRLQVIRSLFARGVYSERQEPPAIDRAELVQLFGSFQRPNNVHPTGTLRVEFSGVLYASFSNFKTGE